MVSERVKKEVIKFQKSEITEYFLYKKLEYYRNLIEHKTTHSL